MGEPGPDVLTRRQMLVDVLIAAGLTALSWSILAGLEQAPGSDAWLLATVHTTALAGRRRAPRTAFAVSTVAAFAYLASGPPMVGLGVAGVVAIYSLAAYSNRRDSLVGLAVGVAVLLAGGYLGDTAPDVDTTIGNVVVLVAAWFVGDGTRRRRALAALYRQRALDLEAAQSELARQAVTGERLRIARELHDIVAHSMSVIAVQAGTGRLVVGDDPERAREALENIERLSREAMDEMRRLLGVLRDAAIPTSIRPTWSETAHLGRTVGDEQSDAPLLEPMPSLGDVDRLVAQAAAAGTTVDVRVTGARRPLAPGAELTVYRIVQEALTNVRRHAPGATAHVELDYGPTELVVTVANDLPAPVGVAGVRRTATAKRSGLGLVGMRERAALYGGTVEAGPTADGTFRVRARVPYDEGPS